MSSSHDTSDVQAFRASARSLLAGNDQHRPPAGTARNAARGSSARHGARWRTLAGLRCWFLKRSAAWG